jgi:aspartyl-tRNA(Asn)/glutamyl-tRNA(Gln) amidotransferase subunit A
LSFSLDHVGPLARTVEDAALMLQAIAGQDANDPTTVASPVPDYLSGLDEGVRGLRIAVPTNYLYDPVSDEVRKLMEASLEVYRGLGAELVEVAIPGIESSNVLVNMIIATEAASFHARWLRERLDDYGRQTRGRMLAGMFYPATRYIEALRARGPMLKAFEDAVFAKADMLHVPILPIPVPTIEDSDVGNNPGFVDFLMAFGHCLRPFNYLGLPSVAVPAGFTADGLPTGFQLVGRAFDQATVIRAASAYEREARWVEKAPPLDG